VHKLQHAYSCLSMRHNMQPTHAAQHAAHNTLHNHPTPESASRATCSLLAHTRIKSASRCMHGNAHIHLIKQCWVQQLSHMSVHGHDPRSHIWPAYPMRCSDLPTSASCAALYAARFAATASATPAHSASSATHMPATASSSSTMSQGSNSDKRSAASLLISHSLQWQRHAHWCLVELATQCGGLHLSCMPTCVCSEPNSATKRGGGVSA
jgi:hypothetical protein